MAFPLLRIVLFAGQATRTSIPHSGTKSRLFKTTIRSHVKPPCPDGPVVSWDGDCNKLDSLPLSALHFLIAPAEKELDLIGSQGDGKGAMKLPKVY